MILQECANCLYVDRLVRQGNGIFCEVHEAPPQVYETCSDFETHMKTKMNAGCMPRR